jgi:hypothetical protein
MKHPYDRLSLLFCFFYPGRSWRGKEKCDRPSLETRIPFASTEKSRPHLDLLLNGSFDGVLGHITVGLSGTRLAVIKLRGTADGNQEQDILWLVEDRVLVIRDIERCISSGR